MSGIQRMRYGRCPACGEAGVVKRCVRCDREACMDCAAAGWAAVMNVYAFVPVMMEFVCLDCARACDVCGGLCLGPDGYFHEACVADGERRLCLGCHRVHEGGGP